MFSKEAFEKFMQDIQKQIDDADKQLQQKANHILKNNSDSYQTKLLTKIAEELKLAKEALAHGHDRRAEEHRVRAEVYKSALEAIKR